jgi:hypothetical protein
VSQGKAKPCSASGSSSALVTGHAVLPGHWRTYFVWSQWYSQQRRNELINNQAWNLEEQLQALLVTLSCFCKGYSPPPQQVGSLTPSPSGSTRVIRDHCSTLNPALQQTPQVRTGSTRVETTSLNQKEAWHHHSWPPCSWLASGGQHKPVSQQHLRSCLQ